MAPGAGGETMRIFGTLMAALAGLVACVGASGAARADTAAPVTIRTGFTVITSGYSPLLLEKKDLMPHLGQTYLLEPRHFQSTSLELTALATGEADIVSIGYSTFALAILNAHMDDIRIVADNNQDGKNGHQSVRFLVRNDGGIARVEDLKGRVLATNGAGGAFDVAMRWMLHKHGLDDKKDYSTIETDYANMGAMLIGRKADLIIGANPWALNPALQAVSHTLFTAADAMGPSQMTMQAARAPFLDQNRAALIDFFTDAMASLRWFHDPAHRDEAVAIVARVTKQPPDQLAQYLFTDQDPYSDPDLRPDIQSLQKSIGVMRDLGFINADVDVKKYVDLSFITAASRRLAR
jgi:NitT/TauT family transport system substrate-binding protein